MNHKNWGVWNHSFFSEILEHRQITFLAHLHAKISSLYQTENGHDSIFASFIPFYICVLH